MRPRLLVLVAGALLCAGLFVAPLPCAGQLAACTDCVLGLYADPQLTQTQVMPSGPGVELYLGIRYGIGAVAELTGIEFSVAGLDSFLVTVQPYDNPPAVLGTPQMPAGADTLSLPGGMNISWGRCLPGDRALAKLFLVPRHAWPQATVLRVKRHYPIATQNLTTPVLVRCDDPYFTPASVRGGTFLLGPAGSPLCSVTAAATDFGMVYEGRHQWLRFTVANTGAGILDGTVSETCPDFWIQDADPTFLLGAGQNRSFTLRFSPTRPGLQECAVTASAAECAPLVFTGRAPDVMPIADLYAGLDTLVGRRVAVEAQVTVPSWSPSYNYQQKTGWVQDPAGYGLEIHQATLLDRTSLRRLSGVVAMHGNMPRLDSLTAVTLLSAGNPVLAARQLTAAEIASRPWPGTFVEVKGRVVSRRGDFPAVRYTLRDDTGDVPIYAVVGPPVPVGDYIVARGACAMGSYQGIWVGSDADFFSGAPCSLRAINVEIAAGSLGQQIEIPVGLSRIESPADTVALCIAYDRRVVHFTGAANAGFTAGWPDCRVDASRPDTLDLFATGMAPIPADSTGGLFRLTFDIAGCSPRRSQVRIVRASGDLRAAHFCDGAAICTDCASNGDVNADGTLTPGDARCAFEIFLAGETVPHECEASGDCEIAAADANCDARVTPGDGLDIFVKWLWDHPAPVACVPKPRPGSTPVVAEPRYRCGADEVVALAGGRFAVSVTKMGLAGPAAFGAEIQFDATRLEFMELRPAGAGTTWEALGARVVSRGWMRVGGFDPRDAGSAAAEATAESWTPLAQLVFRGDPAAWRTAQVEWIEQLPAGPAADPLPATLALGKPYPNPVTRGNLFVELAIPEGAADAVRARVLDVRGRQVRVLAGRSLGPGVHVLHWDRSDDASHVVAAGIYVLEVRCGEKIERRKVVLLE